MDERNNRDSASRNEANAKLPVIEFEDEEAARERRRAERAQRRGERAEAAEDAQDARPAEPGRYLLPIFGGGLTAFVSDVPRRSRDRIYVQQNEWEKMGMINAFGANATVVAYGELYQSLQSGVVDGAENPVGNYKANSFRVSFFSFGNVSCIRIGSITHIFS